jgi:hypothetical protein
MTYTTRHIGEVRAEAQAFGRSDRLGREIGVRVETFEVDYIPTDAAGGYTYAPGHYFGFRGQATRNGAAYGASQNIRCFGTRDERNAAVDKYVAAAYKRAAAK